MRQSELRSLIAKCAPFVGQLTDITSTVKIKQEEKSISFSTCDGSAAITVSQRLVIPNESSFECCVKYDALKELVGAFNIYDDVRFEVSDADLLIFSDDSNFKIPFIEASHFFFIEPPTIWEILSKEIKDGFVCIDKMPDTKMNEHSTGVIIKNKLLTYLLGSVMFFKKVPDEFDEEFFIAHKDFKRRISDIEEYAFADNRLYFRNINEWCMLPLKTNKIPRIEMVFAEMQKNVDSVISVEKITFSSICETARGMVNAATSMFPLDPTINSIKVKAIKSGDILVSGKVGNRSIKVKSVSEDIELNVLNTFFDIAKNNHFLDSTDVIELHGGKSLIYAENQKHEIMVGSLCRS